MPLTAAKIALPKSVAVATVSKAKDTSTIAQLSPSEPQLFLDKVYITFGGAAEAEVVDEGVHVNGHATRLCAGAQDLVHARLEAVVARAERPAAVVPVAELARDHLMGAGVEIDAGA